MTRWIPGLLLAAGLAGAAAALARVAARALGLEGTPVSPVMIAILLGMALANVVRLPAAVRPGLRVAGTRVLRIGIVLLGLRLSVLEVARLGALSVPLVVACIAFGLAFTGVLNRWLALPARLGTLIGVGTSICGVSAIAATGPGIGAKDEEIAYAVAVITVFGLVAMLVYPWIAGPLLGSDPTSVGLFLGTAVHDTSQVNGAGLIYAEARDAPQALDVAIVTKLVRNLFMVLVIPLATLRHAGAAGPRPPLAKLVPAFVLGFVALAAIRTAGDAGLARGAAFGVLDGAAWARVQEVVKGASSACMVVALAAVGLGTDFRSLRRLSLKPFLVGLGAAVSVGAVSLGVIRFLETWRTT